MKNTEQKPDFFKNILVHWFGFLCALVVICFCFYTPDTAQVKINLFYIGSCGVFVLWISSLICRGESVLTKKNFYVFLPLLIYALYIVLSYFLQPYLFARFEDFLQKILYFFLFSVVCFEFEEKDFYILLKYFFIAASLIFVYGLVQVFNKDFLLWKNFFGRRVFATFANPNLLGSFSVFTAILAFFSYLIKPKKKLILLFILALVNLVATMSKGAWFAFALSVLLGSALFMILFAGKVKDSKIKIITVSLLLFICAGISIGYVSSKRVQSLSFRTSTWRATWDMVQAKPLVGTGIGSFELIYPAYKRPEIFYIEKVHNIKSQHAENYFLEQWAVLGILGFGLFLWVLFYVTKQTLYKIKSSAQTERQKALLLMGLFLASASIYLHNLVDVSIYFVSTGLFVTIFNAFIFRLAFGPFEKEQKQVKEPSKMFKVFAAFTFLVMAGIFVYVCNIFGTDFLEEGKTFSLQTIYLIFFLLISLMFFFVFSKVLIKAKRISICFLTILASILFLLFFLQFIGCVCLAKATTYAKNIDFKSISFYTKALHYNPFGYMAKQYRAFMLSNRFSLTEKRDPQRGDGKEISNDFKRALEDFNKVEEIEPNQALLHYNRGSLYLKYATTLEPEKREFYYQKAEQDLKRALLLDPVYDNTYFQLANIAIEKRNIAKARAWIETYFKGPEEVKEPAYLQTHKQNQQAIKAYAQIGGNLQDVQNIR
jgi:Lipid A core - O-antigen ligase and related enzymes